jgi:hypothetical protein
MIVSMMTILFMNAGGVGVNNHQTQQLGIGINSTNSINNNQ